MTAKKSKPSSADITAILSCARARIASKNRVGSPRLSCRRLRMRVVGLIGDRPQSDGEARPEGFFIARLDGDPGPLPAAAEAVDGGEIEIDDPYRFPPLLTDFDLHLHGEGTNFESYRTLGAHLRRMRRRRRRPLRGLGAERRSGQRRRRFQRLGHAPPSHASARRRHLGDFHSRRRRGRALQVFRALALRGYQQQKADPYGFAARSRPKRPRSSGSSTNYQWSDQTPGWRRAPRPTG